MNLEATSLVLRAASSDKLEALFAALPNSNVSALKNSSLYWKLIEAKRRQEEALKALTERANMLAEDLLVDFTLADLRSAAKSLDK